MGKLNLYQWSSLSTEKQGSQQYRLKSTKETLINYVKMMSVPIAIASNLVRNEFKQFTSNSNLIVS